MPGTSHMEVKEQSQLSWDLQAAWGVRKVILQSCRNVRGAEQGCGREPTAGTAHPGRGIIIGFLEEET